MPPRSGRVHRGVRSPDGVELDVLEDGEPSKPTIVFLHGYPDTKELWLDVLARLRGDFHVIAYDVRGAGGSDRPRGPAAYDFERLGDDLVAVIQATAGGEGVHLVGHDWGGIQGWEFATQPRFSGQLRSFTAIAAPALDQVSLGGFSLLRHGRLIEWMSRARRSWYIVALLTPGVPTLAWRGLLAGGRWARLQAAREGTVVAPDYPRPSLAADGVKGANLYRRNIPRRVLRPRRDAVAHVPVQLIVPSHDRFISEAYYERAAEHAPGLRRHLVSGGHWLPRAHPEAVAELVAAFVKEVDTNEVSAD